MAAHIIAFMPGHYHRVPDDLYDIHGSTIGAIGCAIYGYLCRRWNRTTGQCNPSIGTIAKALGLVRNTVKTYLRKLVRCGLLVIEPGQAPEGDASSNNYVLLDPSPAAVKARKADMAAEKAAAQARAAQAQGRASVALPPAELGGSSGALPLVTCCPTGGSADAPKPDLDPQPEEMNHAGGARTEEETPPPQGPASCPHPGEVRFKFDDFVFCLACKTRYPAHMFSADRYETAEEDQAHAASVA
jgi:helix-turn-helix protein